MTASRQREGAALRDVLIAHCEQIGTGIAGQVKARAPELLAAVERSW
jgi:uncharacterized protein YicC (UPF0701 family)